VILADGINLPLVLGYGLAILAPLTLLVVALEMLVLLWFCGIRPATSFKVLLKANVLSTIAGWVVYLFQDCILWAIGIRTLPDFVRLYLYGAMLLIVVYYALSVLVEGSFAAQRKLHRAAGITRGRLWRGIALANVASYLVVGPLFYFGTRLNLGELTFVDDPAAIARCSDSVYFIAADSSHLCRINADGGGFRVVVPHPVGDFLVSRDRKAFAYRGANGSLYFHHLDGHQPILVWKAHDRFPMTWVDISADTNRIAYANGAEVTVFDPKTRRAVAHANLPKHDYGSNVHLAWDAGKPEVLHVRVADARFAWMVTGSEMIPSERPAKGLMGGFCRRGSGPEDLDSRQEQGDLTLGGWPYLGTHIRVTRGRQTLVRFHDNYGVLRMGYRSPGEGSFLSAPGVVVCEGAGCLYVLNALEKKVALLADGRRHVLANGRFQGSFGEQESGKK